MATNVRYSEAAYPLSVDTCEFCTEFQDFAASRFAQTYGSLVTHRVLAEHDSVVVMPTLGQLFRSSLLVLPRHHYETMAQLYACAGSAVTSAVESALRFLGPERPAVLFEHGARSLSGGGCGIYHAHLHVVPLPGSLAWTDVLPASFVPVKSVEDAWRGAADTDEYLLFRDTFSRTVFLDCSRTPGIFRSQYFRRVLRDHFRVERPWDWRTYSGPERELLETLNVAADGALS